MDEDGTGTLSWDEFTQVVLLCQERLERLNRQDEAPMEAVWRGVLGYFDGFSMDFKGFWMDFSLDGRFGCQDLFAQSLGFTLERCHELRKLFLDSKNDFNVLEVPELRRAMTTMQRMRPGRAVGSILLALWSISVVLHAFLDGLRWLELETPRYKSEELLLLFNNFARHGFMDFRCFLRRLSGCVRAGSQDDAGH